MYGQSFLFLMGLFGNIFYNLKPYFMLYHFAAFLINCDVNYIQRMKKIYKKNSEKCDYQDLTFLPELNTIVKNGVKKSIF